jgi:peptidyl-prolyl cis-trans isomerase D
MRKNAGSKVVWLIIGAIAVVFIFFGVGGGGGMRGQSIVVGGEEITRREYEEMVATVARAVQQQGDEISPDEIRRQAVEALVTRRLILQFGRKIGLMATDRAVGRYVAANEEFQTDGVFDARRYKEELTANRLTPADYEGSMRSQLTSSRANTLVAMLSPAYLPKALEFFHFREDQAAFSYWFFPAAGHKAGLAPTETRLKDYYARNSETWRVPAAMTVEYVLMSPDDFLDQVEATEEELKSSYEENKESFTVPATAKVSHILFSFPSLSPSQEEKDAVLARAEAAYARLPETPFEALAAEVSEDSSSASGGGDIGEIAKGMTLPRLEAAIFSLPPGEISRPVETEIGYHLIKVVSREPEHPRPLEEVIDKLAEPIRAFKARELAVTKLEDLIRRTETNADLAAAAASLGLTVMTSDSFTQDQPPEFFEDDQAAVKKAFAAEVGRVAPPAEGNKYLALFKPVERRESFIPPFDDIREAVREAWAVEESNRLARVDAMNFIRQTGGLAASAPVTDAEVKKGRSPAAGRFIQAGRPPFDKAEAPSLFAAMFSVAAAAQVSPVAVPGELDGESGCFVLALETLTPADEDIFSGDSAAAITGQMSFQQINLMRQVWLRELHRLAESEIFVPREFMEAGGGY